MIEFQVHDADSAPEESQKILTLYQEQMGFLPNIFGVLAEAPAALGAYDALSMLIKKTDFSEREVAVMLLVVSQENECHYCSAAHSTIARNASVLKDDEIVAISKNESSGDQKIDALVRFTREIVKHRGVVKDDEVKRFLTAGYKNRHVLELLVVVALKTLTNYTNHVAKTPIDDAFQG